MSQVKKWTKDLDKYFFKKDVPIVNKHMKRCSISLDMRETSLDSRASLALAVKTTVRYQSLGTHQDGWNKITHVWENIEKLKI